MTKKFKCRIKKLESQPADKSGNLGWKVVDVPFDVKKTFGKGGIVPVKGTLNGFAFRNSLFPRKNGPHFLLTNKQILKGANAALGDMVAVEVELDTKERTITTPAILKKALADDPDILEYFNAFNYSMRKYIIEFLLQPKSPDAKSRRLEQIVTVLYEMRDGEHEVPPVLAAEFVHHPKAKRGWELMSVSQKRGHLWGIHYYRPGEARERRIAKAVEAMVALAEKKKAR